MIKQVDQIVRRGLLFLEQNVANSDSVMENTKAKTEGTALVVETVTDVDVSTSGCQRLQLLSEQKCPGGHLSEDGFRDERPCHSDKSFWQHPVLPTCEIALIVPR
jgi:hypothetical protein